MSRKTNLRSDLAKAIGTGQLLELSRVTRGEEHITGFVIAVGRRWSLLAKVMDGGFFDGHVAIRLREIKKVRRDRSFQGAYSQTLPDWPPRAPSAVRVLDLDTAAGMLTSLLSPDRIVGIEQDKNIDAKWIGIPNRLTRRRLYLWEVRPNATWHDRPLGYRLRHITTVTIDDHYQRALAAMAGPAPSGAGEESWATP